VLLFTGDGKGKTTGALGLGLRAFGRGLRVCVIQFIKSRKDTGEARAARRLGKRFQMFPMGRGYVMKRGGTARDRVLAARALELARRKMHECDVLILDEVNCAVAAGLVPVEDVLDLIQARPPMLHVVLTGRGARPSLVRAADTVTNMVKVKHPYNGGMKAVPGVEY
jgi:cob(I)alamin adenosyltransferase